MKNTFCDICGKEIIHNNNKLHTKDNKLFSIDIPYECIPSELGNFAVTIDILGINKEVANIDTCVNCLHKITSKVTHNATKGIFKKTAF